MAAGPLLVELRSVAHGASCECNSKARFGRDGMLRWRSFYNPVVLKQLDALRDLRKRGAGVAAQAALRAGLGVAVGDGKSVEPVSCV